MKSFEKYFPYFLCTGILINANGLLIDILEPDGALYATISKHIALTGDWINLFGDGHDWLDKPHFPFWMGAISFKIFGITAFAYKLPAFVFWLAGIWYTYKLAALFYDSSIAKIAVIIYVFSLHGLLNNFDVRAEPYLTTLIIAAVYYMSKARLSGKWRYIILAALTAACAIMTKGIFVLITVGGGFVIYWIITKQWKQFFNYQWWIMVVLILLFITPELYSLYIQFDLHPEKVVFGRTNVSGLRFFFWDSQFGRFFNTGPIKGHGDPSFFLHTTLWAFLPWSIILYIAVYRIIKKRNEHQDLTARWIIYGSTLITFILFSFSGFQLPHYIVILFPHFSIITAAYLVSISKEVTFKRLTVLQTVLLLVAVVAVSLLSYYSNIGNTTLVPVISISVVQLVVLFFREPGLNKLMATCSAISLVLFLFLFNFFYPRLLQYQAGMMAGKYLTSNNINARVATLNASSYSFEFYAPGFVAYVNSIKDVNNFIGSDSAAAFYTPVKSLPELTEKGYQYKLLHEFKYFHISMLTGGFLNPKTRERELEKMALILVRRKAL
ncbi:glycosyltransferase family 39 protein [Segetibacter sp.]|uniref:ArnT family glycosyltransferase n=1 Tax=Segetibacter sp. TaxID=2231182 RepID=UPI002622AE14|nr:glycosyltransferase family 39 protein [Segetibacter sp.]MCW3080190.1 glycosyl transferase [Segetibacter sp.]